MTTETDATARAQRFLDTHGAALRRAGVALDVEPGSVDDRFLDRAQAGLAAAQQQADGVTCLAVVLDPDARDGDLPLGSQRAVRQEIAVRLAADAFPLVLIFIEAGALAHTPEIYAVGVDGVSDDLGSSGRWPDRFRDDFRIDPGPALELAALQGAAHLGLASQADPRDYGFAGPDRGDVTEYFETHEPGGADALTAMTVFAAGGVGLFWFISRRARLARQRARTGRDARQATPVPPDVLDRVPELLAREFPAIDPQDARTEAGLDAAVSLRAEIADHAVLRDRLTGLLREADAGWTAQDIDRVLPPVEVAALAVLDDRLDAQVEAWEEHVHGGTTPAGAVPPGPCSLNPFHGPATTRSSAVSRSATVELPVCADCRESARNRQPPDVLRVRVGRRTRPYVEVGDTYAQSMFGVLSPLGPAARVPAASGPVGDRDTDESARAVLSSLLLVPTLILLGTALVGGALAIGLSGLEGESFYTDAELAQRAAETGPTIAGYPLGNWLRGAGIGAPFAVLAAGLAAGAVILVREISAGDASPTDNAQGDTRRSDKRLRGPQRRG
jgi:hypothetical protein